MKISLGLDPDLYHLMVKNDYFQYIAPIMNPKFPDLDYLGDDSKIGELNLSTSEFIFGFDLPSRRKLLSGLHALNPGELISNLSTISKLSKIDLGCTISDYVFIGPNVKLGKFVKLNTRSSIHHDCQISDFTVVGPSSTLCGEVKIGACTFIGAGVTVLPRVTIGSNVTVGAGSVVVRNVPNGATVVGNPARPIK
jgi:acetyltransferase EpsM